MTDSQNFPMHSPAVCVRQPLGEFYAVSLSARILLTVTYSNALRVEEADARSGWYSLEGTQREYDEKRTKEIGRYLDGTEAAFPNSIILGANYAENGKYVGDDEEDRSWTISREKSSGRLSLTIPSAEKLAAIIDGQHRLGGFSHAAPAALDMELLCSVYLDLPAPFQAYLFATINFNQKKVDKSLAYELFGFEIDSKNPESWPPEKLAVFLCRRLNVEVDSPFHHRIKVVAENREALEGDKSSLVSTATVVEGLLALFSRNPKADRDMMAKVATSKGRSRDQLSPDGSPLRDEFLACQDAVIYKLTKNYFRAADATLWRRASSESYITRTVGVQGLFDILKEISKEVVRSRDISEGALTVRLRPLASIDFADQFFQASGKGRVRIKNVMRLKLQMVQLDELSSPDREHYARVSGLE